MWFTNDFFQANNFDDFFEDLNYVLRLINSQHYIKKIDETRSQFVNRGVTETFKKWVEHKRKDEKYAYTFNYGARSELQANIGIWGKGITGVRLGYGFDFTRAAFGDPDKAYNFLNIVMRLLKDHNSVTSRIWKTLCPLYYVEYARKEDVQEKLNPQRSWDIQFDQLYDWLNKEDAIWLFFGCFIGIEPRKDIRCIFKDIPSILDEKNSLIFINEFFKSTLDFFEEVYGQRPFELRPTIKR
ncbi:MAG: hypothetical protein ABIB41_12230 [Nitrospirota bacterium]